MVQVTYITFDGKEQTVEVSPGFSLMEGAVKNGLAGVDADCGGNCYCGTCRVYVTPAWRAKAGEPGEYEQALIESVGDADPAVRLSCQVQVTEELNGMVVHLPETQK
jgi:2Fe-2S ferredoxin